MRCRARSTPVRLLSVSAITLFRTKRSAGLNSVRAAPLASVQLRAVIVTGSLDGVHAESQVPMPYEEVCRSQISSAPPGRSRCWLPPMKYEAPRPPTTSAIWATVVSPTVVIEKVFFADAAAADGAAPMDVERATGAVVLSAQAAVEADEQREGGDV